MNLSARTWFFFGFLACATMLGIAVYFQFVEKLEPCPLCITQRILVFLVGIVFLAGAIQNPRETGIRVYAVVGALVALAGASVSTRHVWIQHLPPDQVPECGPGLEYVFMHFPFTKTLEFMLSGTGECAEVSWVFLGMSMPAWTLVGFIMLALLSGAQYRNV
ncbi:MAG: disulfide bond formation protein B [Methylococcales bacterium]